MSARIDLHPLDRAGLAHAQDLVTEQHYLHRPVDVRCQPEGYGVRLVDPGRLAAFAGVFIFGRPEATRCYPWYGSVEDVVTGRAEVTRWQVLNLARVWLSPDVQQGGKFYRPNLLPGFLDRRGVWRSTLATTAIRLALQRIGYDYLIRRPPCFLDEPYLIVTVLSYCDPQYHRGTIYRAAGFELYRTNDRGLQTWRIPAPALSAEQDAQVRHAAAHNERSRAFRARRAASMLGPAPSFTFAEEACPHG